MQEAILVDGAVPASALSELQEKLGRERSVMRLEHPLEHYARTIGIIDRWNDESFISVFDLQQDLLDLLVGEFGSPDGLTMVRDLAYDARQTDCLREKSIDTNILIDNVLRPLLGLGNKPVVFHEWNGDYWIVGV